MSQRKQECKVKAHVKQEKHTRRSALIPHKQLKTIQKTNPNLQVRYDA